MKQKQYYLQKKEKLKAGGTPPAATTGRGRGKKQTYQNNYPGPSQEIDQHLTQTIDQVSSSIQRSVDLSQDPPTFVKVSYPFPSTTQMNSISTSQPIHFVVDSNGTPVTSYVSYVLPPQHENGRL